MEKAERVNSACTPCRQKKRKCDGQSPQCSPCKLRGTDCSWRLRQKPFSVVRRDKAYIQSLESQVQHLSAIVQGMHTGSSTALCPRISIHDHPCVKRSETALENFAFLNWRWSALPGEKLIFSGPGKFNTPAPSSIAIFATNSRTSLQMPRDRAVTLIQKFSQEVELKNRMMDFFLNSVNNYYLFVEPSWLLFYPSFPENDQETQLLYSAIFAVSAHCLNISAELESALLAYTEMLAESCFGLKSSLPVIKATSILAWFKHTLFYRSDGFAYQYMAFGLSTHLYLESLFKPGSDTESEINRNNQIQTFWSLLLAERTSNPCLGIPRAILWDAEHIPLPDNTFHNSNDPSRLYFRYNCQLLRLNQTYIDAIYAPSFNNLSVAEQEVQLCRSLGAMISFRKEIQHLEITKSSTPSVPQSAFWIAYYAAMINLFRPFLHVCLAYKSTDGVTPLERVTTAADSMTDILNVLLRDEVTRDLPPFALSHVFRAALVQCLNMTAQDKKVKGNAQRNLQTLITVLSEMRVIWERPAELYLSFLRYVSHIWGLQDD